ncbi:MAG TPA: N-acetylmuramoyl-L-alanine amidase, partial [Firmicutes bacterium]|nr:N-acetylmuramoyl-L-alanine amidase [Bacillota bacterium]
MRIVIDPGHGGKDPGAVGNGLKEKDIVLIIALEVGRILRAAGQTVLLTRETDRFIDLTAERAPAS